MNSQQRNQMLGMATGMGQSRIESPGSFPQVLPTTVMMPNNQILPHTGNFNASSQLALQPQIMQTGINHMVAAPIVNHQIQETNEIINGKFSYLLDQQGNQGVGVKISKFMPAALQDVLDTPQNKYIWDTFVDLNEKRN